MGISRREVLARIQECESKGIFDEHVDPPNYDIVIPVTEKFHYVPKGFREKTKRFFQKTFIVNPFIRKINKKVVHTIVEGRENIKGIKKAIVTCNHVYMFDCLVAKWAFKPRDLKITAAPFNNQSGFLGEMMRAGGMLPMSENLKAMKNFGNAIKYYLDKNKYVMFYPEQAMWWMYDKPRPYKVGAFHYAVKYDVPVIPIFITYRDTGKFDEEGLPVKDFTIHIQKPIYRDTSKDDKTNMNEMLDKAYKSCVDVYEKTYNKKLHYDIKK